MFCNKCGKQIVGNAGFCGYCGNVLKSPDAIQNLSYNMNNNQNNVSSNVGISNMLTNQQQDTNVQQKDNNLINIDDFRLLVFMALVSLFILIGLFHFDFMDMSFLNNVGEEGTSISKMADYISDMSPSFSNSGMEGLPELAGATTVLFIINIILLIIAIIFSVCSQQMKNRLMKILGTSFITLSYGINIYIGLSGWWMFHMFTMSIPSGYTVKTTPITAVLFIFAIVLFVISFIQSIMISAKTND